MNYLCVFTFLLSTALQAQHDFILFDKQMEQFAKRHQQDSFVTTALRKADAAKQLNDLTTWNWCYVDIRDMLEKDNEKALFFVEKALRDAWRQPGNAEEWEPLIYLNAARGWHQYHLGYVWQAIQSYQQARSIVERFPDTELDAVEMIYKPLGNHFTRLGDNEKALIVFQKALPLTTDQESLAGLYNNIGMAYWNANLIPEAIQNLKTGLALTNISNHKKALLLGALALTDLNDGHPEQAIRSATTALQFVQSERIADPEFRARLQCTAGQAYHAIGHTIQAKKYLNTAINNLLHQPPARVNRDLGKAYIALSKVYLSEYQPVEALQAANKALEAVLPSFHANTQFDNPSAVQFYAENTIFEALTAKACAAKACFDKDKSIRWLHLAAACHTLSYQAETYLSAVFQYQSSQLDLLADAHIRSVAALEVAYQLYLLHDAQALTTGFQIAEQSKSTLLLQSIQDNLVRQLANTDTLFGELTNLRRSAGYFERQLMLAPDDSQSRQWRLELDGIGQKINQIEQQVRTKYPLFQQRNAVQHTTIPSFACLQSEEILIEYVDGDRFIDVFVASANGLTNWHRIVKDTTFNHQIQAFQHFFTDAQAILNAPQEYLKTAYYLWQQLLPESVRTTQKLLIIPDGVLQLLPFEALVTTAPDAQNTLRTAAYLIRNQGVRYAWSLSTVQLQHSYQNRSENGLLGIAPVFSKQERNLPVLDNHAEWRNLHTQHYTEYIGAAATLDVFKSKAHDFNILHFSTHAYSVAGSNPRIELFDAPLLLPDLFALNLQANLVVLSACQTGIGTDQKGEGAMSFARAFASAGAACVLSSLWTVNDASTATVLDRFYYHLNTPEMTFSSALRQSKLDYLSNKTIGASQQSPYFWAGMLAIGDDQVLIPQTQNWSIWFFVGLGVLLISLIWVFLHKKHLTQK